MFFEKYLVLFWSKQICHSPSIVISITIINYKVKTTIAKTNDYYNIFNKLHLMFSYLNLFGLICQKNN